MLHGRQRCAFKLEVVFMKRTENIIEILQKAFENIQRFWFNFNHRHKYLRWLPFAISLYYLIDIIIIMYIIDVPLIFIRISHIDVLLHLGATISFYYATRFYANKNASPVLFLALFMMGVSLKPYLLITSVFAAYIIYRILENRRIKLMEKYANMNVQQIINERKSKRRRKKRGGKPVVDITIRGK
jgi:hypothetical protein